MKFLRLLQSHVYLNFEEIATRETYSNTVIMLKFASFFLLPERFLLIYSILGLALFLLISIPKELKLYSLLLYENLAFFFISIGLLNIEFFLIAELYLLL